MKRLGRRSTAEEALGGVSLAGKRAIVTGVSSGLGRETARVLALAGAEVVGTTREELELTDLGSVRRFVARHREGPLHLLVDNAGVMATPLTRTGQGLELQLATNHLGHFALTLGLLPRLRATEGARIVILSSGLHRRGRGSRLLETLTTDPGYERRAYTPFGAYGDSKLANILFAKELARREPGVLCLSLHPGVIPTRLTRSLGVPGAVYRAVGSLFMKSIPQGAATSVYAATAPELVAHSGAYLADCALARPTAEAEDEALAREVWAASERWLA